MQEVKELRYVLRIKYVIGYPEMSLEMNLEAQAK